MWYPERTEGPKKVRTNLKLRAEFCSDENFHFTVGTFVQLTCAKF